MDNRKTKVKTLRMSHDLVKNIETMADKENRNFNNMVTTILINSFKEWKKRKPKEDEL